MIELMEEDELQELLSEYKLVREMLEMAETEDIYMGGFGRECPLTSVIPRSRDLIKKELNVKQVELRAQIRQKMDEDERQQLGIEEKEPAADPAAGIPKNDYRRHQNGTEEDDGK